MRRKILRTGEQNNSTVTQSRDAMHGCYQFKEEEEIGSVGELSTVCSQIVLKCLYLARVGRPDIFWSVNKLARAVTKWTNDCDKRLARLISDIHHTFKYRQYCYVGNTAQKFRSGLFQDSDFARDLEDSKSTSGELLCFFRSHTFVPISWMCKKQTSVSHSSTEAEVISLDAGLRMDRIHALDLWDLVIEVFHSSPTQSKEAKDQARGNSLRDTTSNKHTQNHIEDPTKQNNVELSNVDYVSSNAKSSLFGAMLFVFDDNEAVIKMIIKGRSPTMRHVPRIRRVALDLLLDRIHFAPKILIRYIDTKHQLADILTKGNFTRDELNNLLHLFNISHFSSICCVKNSSLISCSKTMAKRMQGQKEEEIIVAKPKPTAMNLSSTVLASSSSAKDPIASKGLGKLRAPGKPDAKPDAASSSQGRLKDAHLGGLLDRVAGKPAATDKSQELWEFSASES